MAVHYLGCASYYLLHQLGKYACVVICVIAELAQRNLVLSFWISCRLTHLPNKSAGRFDVARISLAQLALCALPPCHHTHELI